MEDTLRMTKRPIERVNPKILILYGKPKVGKTELLTLLDNCLTLATEDGAEMHELAYYRIHSIEGKTSYIESGEHKGEIASISIDGIYDLFVKEAKRQMAAGQDLVHPYKFIAIDTIDSLEDMCAISATRKFRETILGKNFEGTSVLELSKGLGYWYLRNEVIFQIDRIASLCKYLILISHVKDKVQDKAGIEVTSTDISLTGKLGSIVSAKADAIGYLYREPGKPNIQVSFQTFDVGSTMGSRFKRLAGQKFEFDWNRIYIPEP